MHLPFRITGALFCTAALCALPAFGDTSSEVDNAIKDTKTFGRITPIFNQLVYFHAPAEFLPADENTSGANYIEESVLKGENVNQWTQMLTVTGVKDLALTHPEATPRQFASNIAGGFQHACPSTFAAKAILDGKLDGNDALVMIVSCGTAPAGDHSETAVVAVVKGERDFYTLQWAERAAPSAVPMQLDVNLWAARMKQLLPLKLCPIIPGEMPPYPSCVGR